jgi:pimeloyl-ACP methyl ester carboxylesterase
MTFSCGKLPVPLNYAAPTGKNIDLFLVRIHSQNQVASKRIGSLLVNPGGPGGSGVNLAASLVNGLSDSIFDQFDLVGFDPRGVGLSSPIQCITDSQKDALAASDPDVRTPAGRAQAKTLSSAIVTGCAAQYGAELAHYNTDETAQDMDRLRAALGDNKLNYLGYSYGTRLGAVYAHDFPSNIRAAVLDGAIDPTANDLVQTENQLIGFEDAFAQFSADCATRKACLPLGTPVAAVTALIAAADTAPIPSSASGETRRATGGIVTSAVIAALYDQSLWPELSDALLHAQQGDSRGLFTLADGYNERDSQTGRYSNLLDANLAVTCNDSTLQVTDALVEQQANLWIARYPIFGANAAASLYSCIGWPPSGHTLPSATAAGAPPILVIGTLHDPATPVAGATALAAALGSGVVLTWNGQGHTAYPKTPCITTKVNAYLGTTVVPTDHSCPATG